MLLHLLTSNMQRDALGCPLSQLGMTPTRMHVEIDVPRTIERYRAIGCIKRFAAYGTGCH